MISNTRIEIDHGNGFTVTMAVRWDQAGATGWVTAIGTHAQISTAIRDTFSKLADKLILEMERVVGENV